MVEILRVGRIELRDAADDSPGKFAGIALPWNTEISVINGRERFVRGAFAASARAINSGKRIAYLTKHGADGGTVVGAVTGLEERNDGLHFSGDFLDVPERLQTRSQINSGIDGVSIEFVAGKFRMKQGVREHYADVNLAAIAGSYAPAYSQSRVALRSLARATKGKGMASLSVTSLTERRDLITAQANTIRSIAESEDRALDDSETLELEALDKRIVNVNSLIANAEKESERRDVERQSLPAQPIGSPARVTRAESVYGPGTGQSFFSDLVGIQNRDSAAVERMSRHHTMVVDLASQLERRAVESAELAGAYPTNYYPDLYVPDIAYSGPFGSFFAATPIVAPNPIIVPSFSANTGDTGVQSAENVALPNVDTATTPITLTPKSIGGEAIVSRQAVDGASPGTDVIIANELRELLMRDTEREIALVLEALTTSGALADTAGTTPAASGRDLHRGIASALGAFYAGAAAGGAGARMLPAEGVFVNSTDWGNLVAGEDSTGRPIMPFIAPSNALGEQTAVGFQRGTIGGVPVEPAWAILSALNEIIARRNDARQWKSAVLDVRLMEREGPQSVVFAVFQYFGFAVLQPKGVRRYTYTNV